MRAGERESGRAGEGKSQSLPPLARAWGRDVAQRRSERGLIFIGIGSNLGERASNLEAAIAALDVADRVRVLRRSSVYETEPWGVVDQPRFLNCVVQVETELRPRELLVALKGIESTLGREPTRRWGERVIDLDLLLYGDRRLDEPDLVVPHPELWNRLFVLAPLAELAPDLIAPDGRPIQQVSASLSASQLVRPLATPLGRTRDQRPETRD